MRRAVTPRTARPTFPFRVAGRRSAGLGASPRHTVPPPEEPPPPGVPPDLPPIEEPPPPPGEPPVAIPLA